MHNLLPATLPLTLVLAKTLATPITHHLPPVTGAACTTTTTFDVLKKDDWDFCCLEQNGLPSNNVLLDGDVLTLSCELHKKYVSTLRGCFEEFSGEKGVQCVGIEDSLKTQ